MSNPPTVMGMVGTHSHSVGKSAESVSKATLSSFTGGSLVKRALLEDIGRLCIFFGQEATTDLLLTQVLTFLNDQVFINDENTSVANLLYWVDIQSIMGLIMTHT